MATNVQIHCIKKNPRNNPYERIERVGGVNADGTRWNLPLDDAIAGADAGKWKFYTSVNGDSVWVDVATAPSGRKYLKTRNDGDEPNNLLSLPECP